MSDEYGEYEVASSPLPEAPGTAYPTEAYLYRGFEPGNYTVTSGFALTVTCGGYAPGDWVRVITAAAAPPAPVRTNAQPARGWEFFRVQGREQ